jgi:feruloyl esterase
MKIYATFAVSILLMLGSVSVSASGSVADPIKEIKEIKIPNVTITEVQDVPAGVYTTPGKQAIPGLPAFIRVAFVSKPSPGSNIRSEVWLPKDNWNGRFLGTGNGGGAGNIWYGTLACGVRRGFATANTDMGTSAGVMKAVGRPEIWADFGSRSTHEMTVAAKAILEKYYKKPAHHSYFFGCSTGGQQSIVEAQRFPEDYDGIVAGGPGNNRTHLHMSFIWTNKAFNPDFGGTPISQKKMALLARLTIREMNGRDGGAPGDNFLTDPRMAKFNPKILPRCPEGSQSDSCFTPAEIAALQKMFDGPHNPRTGETIFTGLPLGGTYIEKTAVHLYAFNWAFGENYDYKTFDFDRDIDKMDSILGPSLNANNTDLSPLRKRGGKLLVYAGAFDQLCPYQDALAYYERAVKANGGLKKTQDFFRFFLIPGGGHCSGGPGLSEFGQQLALNVPQDPEHDLVAAMIAWVEHNIAPDKIIATTFHCCERADQIRMQRPVYPYPLFPHYTGGDPNKPSSYKPVKHKRGMISQPSARYTR